MSELKKTVFSLLLLAMGALQSGCGDMVEIQDRDFVMALGISYEQGRYQVTYSLPDLGEVTDQSARGNGKLLRTYEGISLPEIDQYYNLNSENRLDYRHLQIIILDSSVCQNQKAMKDLLIQIDDNYDISHNVLVYYYDSKVSELMGVKGMDKGIGEHLEKLNSNNYKGDMEPAKIGALINDLSNERTLFISALSIQGDSIAVNGGIFFRENHVVKQISQSESEFYFISMGKGGDYLLRLSKEELIQLKEIDVKTDYKLTKEGPDIRIKVSGSARTFPGNTDVSHAFKESLDQYIQKEIELELVDFMKNEGIDYLNLYENSSYKNRQIWLLYENKLAKFIEDTDIHVEVDIHYE